MNRLTHIAVCFVLLASGACSKSSGSGGDDDDDAPSLTSIDIAPADVLLVLATSASGTQAFTATGHYDDESTADLTAEVSWSVANASIGSFTSATLEVASLGSIGADGSVVGATLGDIEGEAYLTVVALGTADTLFTVRHLDVGGPMSENVALVTQRVAATDVFFLVDVTGSMLGEISNLQATITATIIPGIKAEIPNTQIGVGAFADFPVDPYGSTNAGADCPGASSLADQPFSLKQVVTSNATAALVGVNALRTATAPIGCGKDAPESSIEGLYQVATGEGLNTPSPTNVAAASVGFREDAASIVLVISDAYSHAPGETTACGTTTADYAGTVATVAHSRAATKTALTNACVKVLGVASDPGAVPSPACRADADLTDFAKATGARIPPSGWDVPSRPAGCAPNQCCTGINGVGLAADTDGLCSLVFRTDSNGAGLGTPVIRGFSSLTRYAGAGIGVSAIGETESVSGVPLASGTTADFLESVTPLSFVEPAAPPVLPDPTFDPNGFYGVAPGTELTYGVSVFNDVATEMDAPQLFRVRLQLTADGCELVGERTLLFLVPSVH